jgi:hypothetical protein
MAYLAGGDVAALAAQHGITVACLRKRISRQGWAKQRQELRGTVAQQTMETCEAAAKRFKAQMVGEFDEWFELAARQRSRIKDGDFEAFNVVVNGFAKLHSAAFKHHGLEKESPVALIFSGDNTGEAAPETEDIALVEV